MSIKTVKKPSRQFGPVWTVNIALNIGLYFQTPLGCSGFEALVVIYHDFDRVSSGSSAIHQSVSELGMLGHWEKCRTSINAMESRLSVRFEPV